MNKRQAKIEALYIASGLCTSVDHSMFDEDQYTEEEEEKIIYALHKIGRKLKIRAEKLKAIQKN